MARNVYKITTVGLAVALVLVIVLITTPITYFLASTNDRPGHLDYVPEEWSFWTWEDGEVEAHYNADYDNCEVAMVKRGADNQTVTMDLSLACGSEDSRPTSTSRLTGEQHVFITEPADFDFGPMRIDECEMFINYVDWPSPDVESISVDFFCHW